MKDPGLDVMQAVRDAGVPCWRGGFDATAVHPAPPPVYGVFNAHVAPGFSHDDAVQEEQQWVYLSIYGQGDIWAAADRVQAAMLALDFRMLERRDVYDSETGKAIQALSFAREVEAWPDSTTTI